MFLDLREVCFFSKMIYYRKLMALSKLVNLVRVSAIVPIARANLSLEKILIYSHSFYDKLFLMGHIGRILTPAKSLNKLFIDHAFENPARHSL